MTKHRQEAMVQSSMRIPRELLERIDKLADMKGRRLVFATGLPLEEHLARHRLRQLRRAFAANAPKRHDRLGKRWKVLIGWRDRHRLDVETLVAGCLSARCLGVGWRDRRDRCHRQ